MKWLALSFGVLFLGASYLAYILRKEGRRLWSAIERHWMVKTAPWSTPEIQIDIQDRWLWEEAGLYAAAQMPEEDDD